MNNFADPMAEFVMAQQVLDAMRSDLPRVAEEVISAVIAEVPAYSEPFRGTMGRNIENAVALALTGFLESMAGAAPDADRIQGVLDAAFRLGQGEARSGRSMDALAAAYRIGTHRAWDDLSTIAVAAGLPAADVARFAGLVFDYLDRLSAVSVAGHADQLAQDDRLRERQRGALASALVAGSAEAELRELAEQASWPVPDALTAVVLPKSAAATLGVQLDPQTLELDAELPQLRDWPQHMLLLVPGPIDDRSARPALLRAVDHGDVVVGPARPWTEVKSSVDRAVRIMHIGAREVGSAVDTESHLADLVLHADAIARADLRDRVLAPMAGLRPSAREKLTETLRAWLLHQGRRDDIAAALFVHPQTVRYRLGQLRDAYGDRLDDPAFVRDASIALA